MKNNTSSKALREYSGQAVEAIINDLVQMAETRKRIEGSDICTNCLTSPLDFVEDIKLIKQSLLEAIKKELEGIFDDFRSSNQVLEDGSRRFGVPEGFLVSAREIREKCLEAVERVLGK